MQLVDSLYHLCHLCDKQYYQKHVSNLNHSDFTTLNQQTHSILNPIISLTEEESNLIVELQTIYYRKQSKPYPFPFDSLYGFDFFIQGCCLLVKDERLQEAVSHFLLFNHIQGFTNSIFKRQSPEIKNITNKLFNEICDELIRIIKNNIKNYTLLSGQSQDYLSKISLIFLQQIEKLQFVQHEIYQSQFQLTLDRKEKLHILQVELACLLKNFSEKAIFTRLYNSYLQSSSLTDQIGAILFKQIVYCESLWQVFFQKLTTKQRLSHITTLVQYLTSGQFDEALLINIIQLGHALKKVKEYWLSLVIYSLFRKLYIILIEVKKMDHLIPIVYYQMAKLCVYLGQFNESYKLYKEGYEKLEIEKNKTQERLFSKLLYKLLMLSIFLNKHDEAIKFCIELQKQTNITQQIYDFTNYFHYQTKPILSSQQQYRKLDQFRNHLHHFIIKNSTSKVIPTDELKRLANIIELKDSNIPKNSSKIEIQLPENCNLFFNTLQFYFILVGNLQVEQLSPQQFTKQQNLLDNFLQSSNVELHSIFQKIIESFSIPNQYYENLLLCHFYQYRSENQLSQTKLILFNKTRQKWKNRISHQDHQLFEKIIENYQSKLLQFSQQSEKDSKYKFAMQQIRQGKFREGVENLINLAGQHGSEYFEICYAQLLELLKKSRETTSQFQFGQFRNDIREFTRQINFDQLHSQKIELSRSLSQSQIINEFQIAQSLEVSQYYRSNSSCYEYEDYKFEDLTKLFSDQQLLELIQIVSEEQKSLEQFSLIMIYDKYPKNKELQRDVTLYFNDNDGIVVKKKSIANMDKSIVESKLKETLIEIQCQMLVNKLNNPAFAKLISLQYKFVISSKYAIYLEFYLIFPYYQPLDKMGLNQLQYLTESIRILNENQIYHRDLKPSNILMQDNLPVIIDFDCSYYWEPTLHSWLGGNGLTNHYYPKEDELFDKVDIYSLGLIAKEKVINCSEEFFLGATMKYRDRCSLSMLLEKIQ